MSRIAAIPLAVTALLSLGTVFAPPARAQSSSLKVIGSDSVPIPYTWVSIQGGEARITDERGLLNLGAAHHKTLTANVRRLGYQPWFGKLELPDTAVTLTVVLPRISQELAGVTVTSGRTQSALQLTGFYDRWLQRQKGTLSATFVGPEEIEFRHPDKITNMLGGVPGVSLVNTPRGAIVARGNGGACFMTVLLDRIRLCPDAGCNNSDAALGAFPQISKAMQPHDSIDAFVVDINKYIDANDVAAIEVYARGGNMPISLQADDNGCGVIAIWTGSRR